MDQELPLVIGLKRFPGCEDMGPESLIEQALRPGANSRCCEMKEQQSSLQLSGPRGLSDRRSM
jgi:hypothetical protein